MRTRITIDALKNNENITIDVYHIVDSNGDITIWTDDIRDQDCNRVDIARFNKPLLQHLLEDHVYSFFKDNENININKRFSEFKILGKCKAFIKSI